ncbi:MAG: AAA family ATPase [Lachnospiraceae bacterium]|nr:AAA family ATPase [Lachnospiraceae bacterium]
MKEFNTTACCIPEVHYMVDLKERVEQIKELVDGGKYFVINRARQYGKTTTLVALQRYLSVEYDVIFLDFQNITASGFSGENDFAGVLAESICELKDSTEFPIPDDIYDQFQALEEKKPLISDLFGILDKWCRQNPKGIVLMIDEADSASNNQVFLDFLSVLRARYIKRQMYPQYKTFQSVILAGVTDIRYLKAKIRDDAEARENSPWNIAADFKVDMSLSETGIKGMLDEYEEDHHTGMDTAAMAKLIREYTNGYPFLVSRLCQLMDREVSRIKGISDAWTRNGFEEAVKMILTEDNTLFQTLNKNLNNSPKLKESIRSVLMEGERIPWSPDNKDIVLMRMYGLIRCENNSVRIDNRIFESRCYNMFLSEEEMKKSVFFREGGLARNIFVDDGKLNVRLILERFIDTYNKVCGPLEDSFKEKDGRELFLLYLRPIINGTGNYYIEAQTRDERRTDVIIDYLGQQYIIELKIWHGERYNAEGEKQISEYLDYFGLSTGYMLSFNFNKKKEQGVKRIEIGDRVLFEGML